MSFEPNWIVSPRDVVTRRLEQSGIPKEQILKNDSCNVQEWHDFFDGLRGVDDSIASGLAQELGVEKDFWIRLQNDYVNSSRRVVRNCVGNERFDSWYRSVPYSSMAELGWLPRTRSKPARVAAALDFFHVSNFDEWEERFGQKTTNVLFKRSHTATINAPATSAWLHRVTEKAADAHPAPWNRDIFAGSIHQFKAFTLIEKPSEFLTKLSQTLSDLGVIFVFVDAPKGCGINGATFFLDGAPILAMSMRFRTDDHFWFSFFHECAHLIHHSDRTIFLEGEEIQNDPFIEQEANHFAQEFLFPEKRRLPLADEIRGLSAPRKLIKIYRAAKQEGVAPGIVVGQLQHHGHIPYSHFNKLKVTY